MPMMACKLLRSMIGVPEVLGREQITLRWKCSLNLVLYSNRLTNRPPAPRTAAHASVSKHIYTSMIDSEARYSL